MKVLGQLEGAQLEQLEGDPANAPTGRIYMDVTTPSAADPKVFDGTSWISLNPTAAIAALRGECETLGLMVVNNTNLANGGYGGNWALNQPATTTFSVTVIAASINKITLALTGGSGGIHLKSYIEFNMWDDGGTVDWDYDDANWVNLLDDITDQIVLTMVPSGYTANIKIQEIGGVMTTGGGGNLYVRQLMPAGDNPIA